VLPVKGTHLKVQDGVFVVCAKDFCKLIKVVVVYIKSKVKNRTAIISVVDIVVLGLILIKVSDNTLDII
jgi:hypothetical protein